MTQINIQLGQGKVSDLLYDLMTSTKAKKFRAGFNKSNLPTRTRHSFFQILHETYLLKD